MAKALILVLIFSLYNSIISAETIKFKSGRVVEAEIIEQTNDYIRVDFHGMSLTYYFDEIESIDGERVTVFSQERETESKFSYGNQVERNAVQIFNELAPAVVYVRAGASQGSGFIVDRKGLVVTNWHVVGSSERVNVELKDGRSYLCTEVTNYDILKDIFICKIDAPDDLTAIPLADFAGVQVGEKAYVIGNPLGMKYRITDGIVAQKEDSYGGYGRIIQFTCPIARGNSGGPLLNRYGKAVGIVTSTSADPIAQNINFAVSVDELSKLLRKNRRLSFSEYVQSTKGYGAIQEGYQIAAYDGPEAAYQFFFNITRQFCLDDDFEEGECLLFLFEMVRFSSLRTGPAFTRYAELYMEVLQLTMKEKEISDELMRKAENLRIQAINLSSEHVELIETFGGLKKLRDKFSDLRPPKEVEEILLQGYFNRAVLAFNHGQPEVFDLLFENIKNAFPGSKTLSLLKEASITLY